jgi:hypothetical protein
MKMKKLKLIGVGLLFSACCLTPGVYARGIDVGINIGTPAVVYADTTPPAPIVEVQPVSPGPDYVWLGGSWVWGDNHRWTWEKGRWERPPHAGMRYVPHHFEDRDGRHTFQRGGWRDK